ncbi:replication-relaxation family protein [Streptomyces endophyticus]|uniref:Replication-relaxation family protein n=1 Tax=Streptomyces endophyticus TaxID=714166 RepID=A0ABU6F210_9ACTN|nr:replication-relaxation family protein [Streptomyces endophyticus]MEB8338024.1 replication-relaxation family protein [Streptomyces endophyticus]
MNTPPTPQRSLRAHRPHRPAPRAATNAEYIARLAGRLTERDQWLARMLYEHKVLTTGQITQLAWPSTRSANLRLLRLYQWRVVDRFQPFATYGSAPMHYVLDIAGAAVLARQDGLEQDEFGYRHDRALGLAHSLRLAHTVATNTFFTTLVDRSRHSGNGGRLTAWWSEARCRGFFGDIVRPDAYGRWRERGAEFEWFLEYDWGTERPADLVGEKLPGYAHLAATSGITTPILFWTPTARREERVRRALDIAAALLEEPSLVPAATTCTDLVPGEECADPAVRRWLPLGAPTSDPGLRLCLTELPTAWSELPAPGTAAAARQPDPEEDPEDHEAMPGPPRPPSPQPPSTPTGPRPRKVP